MFCTQKKHSQPANVSRRRKPPGDSLDKTNNHKHYNNHTKKLGCRRSLPENTLAVVDDPKEELAM
jgi:hypothetical protein